MLQLEFANLLVRMNFGLTAPRLCIAISLSGEEVKWTTQICHELQPQRSKEDINTYTISCVDMSEVYSWQERF